MATETQKLDYSINTRSDNPLFRFGSTVINLDEVVVIHPDSTTRGGEEIKGLTIAFKGGKELFYEGSVADEIKAMLRKAF
jgi:hypothetical protein